MKTVAKVRNAVNAVDNASVSIFSKKQDTSNLNKLFKSTVLAQLAVYLLGIGSIPNVESG